MHKVDGVTSEAQQLVDEALHKPDQRTALAEMFAQYDEVLGYWHRADQLAQMVLAVLQVDLDAADRLHRARDVMRRRFPANSFYVNGMKDQYAALAELYDEVLSYDLHHALEE